MLRFKILNLLLGILGVLVPSLATSSQGHNTIQRDVCIIGGGSAGTYAAWRLTQMGKTVALLEKQGGLGGQVDTYTDPSTGKTIDYGVKVFNNVSVVTNYFASLNVPLTTFSGYLPGQTTIYADLATASDIPVDKFPPAGNLTEGLLRYQAQLDKYPYLQNGFDLPDPIPEDLLMSWGDFMDKYDLSSIAGLVYGLVGGPGNILAQTTLYVAKNFNQPQINSALQGTSLTEANGNNQALYDAALEALGNGSNVFVRSNVTNVIRSTQGVEVEFDTPSGLKTVKASKLIVAIPPKLSNLLPFLDLSQHEQNLFSEFNNSYLYASIVANSGIPEDKSLANVDLAAPFGIPEEPGIFLSEPTGINGHVVLYGSPRSQPESEVRANIVASLSEWKKASSQSTQSTKKPEIIAFSSHTPYFLTVSNDAIRHGFYTQTNQLQGQRNTFYTGAAWATSDSTAIWNFTETQILPRVLASLE